MFDILNKFLVRYKLPKLTEEIDITSKKKATSPVN